MITSLSPFSVLWCSVLTKSIFSILVLRVHVEQMCTCKRACALSQHERGQRMLAESNIACLIKPAHTVRVRSCPCRTHVFH